MDLNNESKSFRILTINTYLFSLNAKKECHSTLFRGHSYCGRDNGMSVTPSE